MILLLLILAGIEALVLATLVCETVARRLREPAEPIDTTRGTGRG